MKRYTLFTLMLAIMLGFAFTAGKATLSVSSAVAGEKESKDSGSKDSREGSKDDAVAKVIICHAPPGNPASRNTLSVDQSAVDAHLAHGDSMGACPAPSCICAPGVASCICPDGTAGGAGPAAAVAPGQVREVFGN